MVLRSSCWRVARLRPQKKLTFMSSWKAQAEHGGYYQAIAKGFYKACDIDLTFRQGGPGVDGKQLLVGGAIDMMMASYNNLRCW